MRAFQNLVKCWIFWSNFARCLLSTDSNENHSVLQPFFSYEVEQPEATSSVVIFNAIRTQIFKYFIFIRYMMDVEL
jgi:hypothetical protein